MKRPFFMSLLFLVGVGGFAQVDSSNINFKRMNYGLELSSTLMLNVVSYEYSKSKSTIGLGVNAVINYNINEQWAVSTGLGIYIDKHEYQLNTKFYELQDTAYHKDEVVFNNTHKFVQLHLPLFIQYTVPSENGNNYFVKAGVKLDHKTYIYRKEIRTTANSVDTTTYYFRNGEQSFWDRLTIPFYYNVSPSIIVGKEFGLGEKSKVILNVGYFLGFRNPFLYSPEEGASAQRTHYFSLNIGVML